MTTQNRYRIAVSAILGAVLVLGGVIWRFGCAPGDGNPSALNAGPEGQGTWRGYDPLIPEAAGKFQQARSICRDARGAIWIGTEADGVYRYDPVLRNGHQWTHFTTADGLGDDSVYALACDGKGRIWAGHVNHGVSVYLGGRSGSGPTWQNYGAVAGSISPSADDMPEGMPPPRQSLAGPLGERVFHIAIDPADGDVWIATNMGLSRYSVGKDEWSYYTRASGLPGDTIASLAFDSKGDIYVATRCDGVAMARAANDYHAWRIVRGPDQMPTTPQGDGLPGNLLNDILVDEQGTVWLATSGGLAWSKDAGQTWRFTRGLDWADNVRGLLAGPPQGWSPGKLDVGLAEDDCLCLGQSDGILWIGHRHLGYESLNTRDMEIQASVTTAGDRTQAILAGPDGALIANHEGLSGDGHFALDAPQGDARVSAGPALAPSGAKALAVAQFREMIDAVNAVPLDQGNAGAFMGEDWLTRGDWMGRYGRYWISLLGMDRGPINWGGGHEKIVAMCQVDPRFKGAGVYSWIGSLYTDNPSCLEMNETYLHSRVMRKLTTWEVNRRSAQINDHAEKFPASRQGPNLYVTVPVPAGHFRLSTYAINGNGDYRVALLANAPVVEKTDQGNAQILVRTDTPHEFAHARLGDAGSGVWESFLVSGPAHYTIEIDRNHTHNTSISAVALDTLDELPYPYYCSYEQWEAGRQAEQAAAARAPASLTASEDNAAALLAEALNRARMANPAWYYRNAPFYWLQIIRRVQSSVAPAPPAFSEGLFALHRYQAMEEAQLRQGIRPARVIEQSLRWDGKTQSNSFKGYDIIRKVVTTAPALPQ